MTRIVTGESILNPACSNQGAYRTDYQFDNAQRLSSFIQDFPNSGLDLTNTFTYNPASQVTQFTQSNTLYQYTGNENRTGTYTING